MKWASIISSLRPSKDLRRNHHFVFIEAPKDVVAPEIILWGEAGWWPKKCTMRFTRLTSGEIKEGTRFKQEVLIPRGPSWEVEVTKIVPGESIERMFLTGIIDGKETVSLDERLNGTRVDYVMDYKIKGRLNSFLWALVFEGMHDKNITLILQSLKEYCHKKVKELKKK